MDYVKVNGIDIPALGLGTYQMGEKCVEAVSYALKCGYRLIDTASIYENENSVGEAIKQSHIERTSLCISTKIWPSEMKEGLARKSIEDSLRNIGIDYLDIVLLHWPFNDIKDSWQELEKAYDEGLVRIIGVSNFQRKHLDGVLSYAKYPPMINQFERNPFFQQAGLLSYCREHKICSEAWGPLGKGNFENPIIDELACKYNKTSAQIVLKWLVSCGSVALPKSVTKERIKQNIEIFDFDIEIDDIELINRIPGEETKRYYPPEYAWD